MLKFLKRIKKIDYFRCFWRRRKQGLLSLLICPWPSCSSLPLLLRLFLCAFLLSCLSYTLIYNIIIMLSQVEWLFQTLSPLIDHMIRIKNCFYEGGEIFIFFAYFTNWWKIWKFLLSMLNISKFWYLILTQAIVTFYKAYSNLIL